MQRVSSNLTIFFKLFIPTVWIVFFSIFTASIFLVNEQTIPLLTSPAFRYPFLAVYIIFLLLIYFTLIQLKRVELDDHAYYVSNYFKTFKLIYEDIESISIVPLSRLQLTTFRLKAKGSFGKKITFLASKQLWDLFLDAHPDVKNHLLSKVV
jgi:hypothetical protein